MSNGLYGGPMIVSPSGNFTEVYSNKDDLPVEPGFRATGKNSDDQQVTYRLVKNTGGAAIPAKHLVVASGEPYRTAAEVEEATTIGKHVVGVTPDGASDIPDDGWGWIIEHGPCLFTYGNEGGPVGGAKVGAGLRLSKDSDGGKVVEDYGEIFLPPRRFVLHADGTTFLDATADVPGPNVTDNRLTLEWASTETAAILAQFVVPEDYDENADEVAFLAWLAQTGSNDSVNIDVAVFIQSDGSAAGGDQNPGTISATQGAASDDALTLEGPLAMGGSGLARGDIVSVKITPSAHANDALDFGGMLVRYQRVGSPLQAFEATSSDDADVKGFIGVPA